MFQLDLKSRKSIYEQIVDNLKGLMVSGVLKPEEKLPSVRELSRILTVNPNTIQKAYRELERQGYTYMAPGLGTFVVGMKPDEPDPTRLSELTVRLGEILDELHYLGVSDDQIQKITGDLLTERRNLK